MDSLPSQTTFTMPLPKLPMDEITDRVCESLEKMDRREAAEKRRREALEEKRWRERCKKMSNGDDKWPLFPTWASAGASSSELLDDELEADAVGSSSLADEEALSDKEDSAVGSPPYKSKYSYPAPAKTAPEPIPEEELIRRRKVEQELMALSKKITEEKLRKERMIPLVWDKPTFDPFPDAAADSSEGASSSRSNSTGEKSEAKEPQIANPRKRDIDQVEGKKPYRYLNAIGVPPQASSYYTRDESLYGRGGHSMGFGCFSHCSQEEIDDFVAIVDKMIPATNP